MEVNSLAAFEKNYGRGSLMHTAVYLFFENGGKRAVIVRQRDPGLKAFYQALHALDSVEDVNLVCLPSQAPLELDLLHKAVDYCEGRRAFLLLDPDAGWSTPEQVAQGVATMGVASRNAALYFPTLKGRGGSGIPPAGAVAGVIARTDRTRGVWKAPAGVEAVLNGIRGLSQSVTEAFVEKLTGLFVNPLWETTAHGLVVWGARTLAGNDNEWRYIPVRRTALFIEESIYRSTSWVVFEPNAQPLWGRLGQSIENFLHELYKQGAFQGVRPDEAYFVRCDTTTMTQADISAGRVIVLVGFAPLKPAEFVILKITLLAAVQP
jgi:phage tail sheath protein FI